MKINPAIPRHKGLPGWNPSTRMAVNMNMDTIKAFQHSSFPGSTRAAKRERAFEISLPALVRGSDACGRKFEERTEIYAISAQEASFRLKARLLIGTKITVSMDIPRTLILEQPLRLSVTGDVVHVRSEEENAKRQFVAVHLDRRFRLSPDTIPAA